MAQQTAASPAAFPPSNGGLFHQQAAAPTGAHSQRIQPGNAHVSLSNERSELPMRSQASHHAHGMQPGFQPTQGGNVFPSVAYPGHLQPHHPAQPPSMHQHQPIVTADTLLGRSSQYATAGPSTQQAQHALSLPSVYGGLNHSAGQPQQRMPGLPHSGIRIPGYSENKPPAPGSLEAIRGPRTLPGSLQGAPMPHGGPMPTPNFPTNSSGSVMASADSKVAMEAVIDALSVSKIQPAEPPVGSLLVPLLKHQKLALGWMLSREGARSSAKALCPDGGMLADDQVCTAAFVSRVFCQGSGIRCVIGCLPSQCVCMWCSRLHARASMAFLCFEMFQCPVGISSERYYMSTALSTADRCMC